jgi:SAM-dependent methyltransferase
MKGHQYFAVDSLEDLEWERLGSLQEVCDPITTRRITALGVRPGWHCLEIGAGRGSISGWLAEQVVPSGRVVAADLNPQLLRRAQFPSNVEIREHNILTQDLEPGSYDLVCCRYLLTHLPDPEWVMQRMVRALRPGGWLFIEDADFRPFGAVDAQYPGAAEFDRTFHACWDGLHAVGRADPFGRRSMTVIERIGLESTGAAGEVLLGRGGEHPYARFWSLTFQTPGMLSLVEQGYVTHEAYDAMRARFDDPDFQFVGSVQFSVWGRRPVHFA